MAQKFGNNGTSTLSAGISASDVTIFIAPGQGSRFPTITAPDFCYGTFEDASGNIEIVKVTAHSAASTSFTVLRAQQGTTARSYGIGDLFELRMTALEATAWEVDIDNLEATRSLRAGDTYTGSHNYMGATLTADTKALSTANDEVATTSYVDASIALQLGGTAVVVPWVSGQSYTIGKSVFSLLNFKTYRRKTNGSGTIDPSEDPTHWGPQFEVTLAGEETLTNKRISAFYVLDKFVSNTSATGTVSIDLMAASNFNLTLTGDTTLSVSGAPTLTNEMLSFAVTVSQGPVAKILTWFSGITWLTTGGTAPSAPAANKTVEYVFTTTSAGAYVGRKGAAT